LTRWWFFRAKPAGLPHESILGVQLEDDSTHVRVLLHVEQLAPMNPWATARRPSFIGHLLHAEDLALPPEDLARLELFWNANNTACGIFFENKLRALVVQAPYAAATGRGLK